MDITLDAGELYFGLNAATNLETELLNLSNAINGVSVSSELPSAAIFSNLKTALVSTINSEVNDLITRLENSKRILREYDEEAAMLFTFFDNGIINGDFEFTEMPLLDQTDYTNIKYSQGTVATSGCGITSVCMVASYFTGNLYTPEDLAAMANKSGSNNIDRMTWAADYVGLKWYCNENTSTNDLKQMLSEGKTVIILVKNSSHFVVCKGITEDGKILVNDPYGPWAKDEPYTLNDLINGKIKKVDVDSLKKIAETLDLSLVNLLKVAGYDEFLDFLSLDKYKNKSTKDLKEMIEKHKKSELDLLDFDAQKRKKVRNARQKLFFTMEHLDIMQKNKDSIYTVDKAIEDIKVAFDELESVEEKYDYNKLPKDF